MVSEAMTDDESFEKHELEGFESLPNPDRLSGPDNEITESDRIKEEEAGIPSNENDIEAGKASMFSDWESPDDPGNPRNWSFRKRVFHTAIPALYGFVV
jgi:hypothetical protein